MAVKGRRAHAGHARCRYRRQGDGRARGAGAGYRCVLKACGTCVPTAAGEMRYMLVALLLKLHSVAVAQNQVGSSLVHVIECCRALRERCRHVSAHCMFLCVSPLQLKIVHSTGFRHQGVLCQLPRRVGAMRPHVSPSLHGVYWRTRPRVKLPCGRRDSSILPPGRW